jgi:hypothetical protein
VATSLALEGLSPAGAVRAGDAGAFAEAVAALLRDDDAWTAQAEAAHLAVLRDHAPAAERERLSRMVASLGAVAT